MKLALILTAAAAITLVTGCGTPGAPQPPSLQLPQVPQDLAAIRKGQRVLLTWTTPRNTTDEQVLRHPASTRICRSPAYAASELQIMEGCSDPVGEAPPGAVADNVGSGKTAPKSSYVDSLPAISMSGSAPQWVTYAIESANTRGRSAGLSNQVKVSLALALAAPRNVGAGVTADGIVISWSGDAAIPSSEPYQFRYRVERRVKPGSVTALPVRTAPAKGLPRGPSTARNLENFLAVGELAPDTRGEYSLVDKSFVWEQDYEYKVSAVTSVLAQGKSVAEVEGDDSPVIEVAARDIFPPAIPASVEAVFSGLSDPSKRFIDLSWAPNGEPDLAGYNVYRRQGDTPPQKINQDLVKTPAYRDAGVQPGTTYLYSVSAVDVRNNESGKSAEASEKVPQ